MPAERFYTNQDLHEQYTISLADEEFQHLRVMRPRTGEIIELVNGRGVLAQAEVVSIEKKHATLFVKSVQKEEPSKRKVILAQALPKLNRLDFIIEKGTELGADSFWLFPGEQSVKTDVNEHQINRFEAIAIAAMKQCGRLYLPEIIVKPILEKWNPPQESSFFGDLDENAPSFLDCLKNESKESSILFFVGPEAGFSEKEIHLLKNLGAKGVRLHSNILRTDTASLAALSIINYFN